MTRVTWHWYMLAAAILCGLLFTLAPGLDPWISGLFYEPDAGFPFNYTPLGRFVVKGMPPLLFGVLAYILALWAAGLYFRERFFQITGRICLFLSASLAIGPGLIVNGLLKELWGRARPAQILEFGGQARFTPALLPSDQCETNCSFVAGHPSLAFWTLALALLVPAPWRRSAIAVSLAFGLLTGLARIAQGKHFASDVTFSALITLSVVLLLYDRLIKKNRPV